MRLPRCSWCLLALLLLNAVAAHAFWDPLSLGRLVGSDNGKANSPSVVSRMAGGTKRMVSNTTGMLTPKKTMVKKSGTTAIQRAPLPRQEKQGFFKSLFHP